jgi:phage gpG-like protein
MKGFSMKTVGNKAAALNMRAMGKRARNLEPALKIGGERMIASKEQTFRVGGRPEKWEPSQRVKKQGGKTLIQTGELKNSVWYLADNKTLRVGSNKKYAAPNQFGVKGTQRVGSYTKRIESAFGKKIAPRTVNVKAHTRKQNIPARPFIIALPSDLAYISRTALKYITGGTR